MDLNLKGTFKEDNYTHILLVYYIIIIKERLHLHQQRESQTGSHMNSVMNKKKTTSAANRNKDNNFVTRIASLIPI